MKKIAISVFMFLILFTLKAQKVPLENTILWKINGTNLTKPSYIILTGTNCDEDLKQFPEIKTILKDVSAVIVEYDLYNSKDASKLGSNNLATVDSEKLQTNISGGEYLKYSNILKNMGLPDNAVNSLAKYKIGMAYYMLSLGDGPCGVGHEPLAYETQLKPLAMKNNLSYEPLQSIDEFIKEYNQHTNYYWKQNILYHLNNEGSVKQLLQTEAELYKAKKIQELHNLYNSNDYFLLRFSDSILQRHTAFLTQKIEKEIKKSPSLISIDISNVLFTERSVFEQLKEKGYEISPVME